MTHLLRPLAAFSLAMAMLPAASAAQTAAPHLTIELNAVEAQGDGCRLTFLAENGMGANLSAAVVETVLFDRGGQVIDLTLFDFRDLPAGRPRVRQFDLPGVACETLGRVLLNDIHACQGEGVTREGCAAALRWSSRTDVKVLG